MVPPNPHDNNIIWGNSKLRIWTITHVRLLMQKIQMYHTLSNNSHVDRHMWQMMFYYYCIRYKLITCYRTIVVSTYHHKSTWWSSNHVILLCMRYNGTPYQHFLGHRKSGQIMYCFWCIRYKWEMFYRREIHYRSNSMYTNHVLLLMQRDKREMPYRTIDS